jgi:TatD DNase family protein
MVGIHPGYAGEWSHGTAAELRRVVTTGVPLAIGEIGLDFYRGETNVAEQVTAFTGQLALAREFDLPACIHMRNAEDMVIEVLSEQPELPVLLFHSFDGSPRLVRWILEHDAWIGVGGLATRPKSAELRSNIARVGLERIVLETDSPFLVPTGFKHRRNTPESIPLVAHTVAEVFGVDWSTVARCTTENALRVFRKLSAI